MEVEDWLDKIKNENPSLIQPAYLFLYVVYSFSIIALTAAFSFNWYAGIIVSLIIVVIIFLILRELNKKTIGEFPLTIVFVLFASVILFETSLFGAISYSLFQANIAVYEPQEEIDIEKLRDFYIWYFFDMIPGLDICKTLDVQSPIKAQGTWAGVPILAFRLLVIIPVFWLVKRYIGFVKQCEDEKARNGDIYLGKYFYNKGTKVTSGNEIKDDQKDE